LTDLDRFPVPAQPWVVFSREIEQHIDTQKVIYPWRRDFLEVIRSELVAERKVWDALADAQRTYWQDDCCFSGWPGVGCVWAVSDEVRRAALRRLRELLGEADYAAGRMPPPVPWWTFRPID